MGLACSAQQDALYTQFLLNKSFYNPGYTGSLGGHAFTVAHRSQWLGLDGAPESQLFSYSTPMARERVGLGLHLQRFSLGIQRQLSATGAYAYRIPMKTGHLGLGIQASLREYRADYTDERLLATEGIDPDPAIEGEILNAWQGNIGFGLFYEQERFFAGLSIPGFVKNDIDLDDSALDLKREARHLYLMGGYRIDLGSQWVLTPQLLWRLAEDAPADLDINLMAFYEQVLQFGLSARGYNNTEKGLLESLDILFGVRPDERLLIGLAYDFTLSDLKDYESGSLEAVIRYRIPKTEKVKVKDPRYF